MSITQGHAFPEDIRNLFKKFFAPLLNLCPPADDERAKAFRIATVLWAFLAIEGDTEDQVYHALYDLFHTESYTLQFSLLYFTEMKPVLTEAEMARVHAYYEDDDHVMAIREWTYSQIFL